MKRPLPAVLCLLLLPSLLFAQADPVPPMDGEAGAGGEWKIVAMGGWTFPFEPAVFDEHFKTNFNAGGGIAYAFPRGGAGYGEVSFVLHYYNVLFTRSGFRAANGLPPATPVTGYPGDVYTGMAQFRGVLSNSTMAIAPYFTVGFGVFHIALAAHGRSNGADPQVPEYEKSAIGWSAGLGTDVKVTGRIALFGEGKFLLGVTETNGHKLFSAGGGVRLGI